jgi:hypothetical protein
MTRLKTHLSIITLNVNSFISLIKKIQTGGLDWKKMSQPFIAYREHITGKDKHTIKGKVWKRLSQPNGAWLQPVIDVLISDKEKLVRRKKGILYW